MAAVDYLVMDEQTLVVEWERDSGDTRLLTLKAGDSLFFYDLYGRTQGALVGFRDWGADKGWHVYLADGGIVHIDEFLRSWGGCWSG